MFMFKYHFNDCSSKNFFHLKQIELFICKRSYSKAIKNIHKTIPAFYK